jgi:2-(1,2-epoxy-1,2-dihydrophenyl)acetyl-CoA isomerase
MARLVKIENDEQIAILTLTAPQKRNAISVEMRTELLAALAEAANAPHIRAIILTGEGEHFCAGGDLSAAHATAPDPRRTETNVKMLQDIVRLIVGPKPVLAAVEGSAFGAGMSLAVACDFILAGQGARFAASFAKIGLCADAGLTWMLPQRVGFARSRQLMISGDVVDADRALAIGLIDETTAKGGALDAARSKARMITKLAPLSIATVKAGLTDQSTTFDEALDLELRNQVRLASSTDYLEGRAAFVEKRSAKFRGI